MKEHKHAEVLRAIADGKEVEFKLAEGHWACRMSADLERIDMSIEAMKLALDALEYCIPSGYGPTEIREDAITALRAAIELAEKQEPVAWADKYDIEREGHDFYVNRQQPSKDGVPLYTAPLKPS